MNPKFVWFNSGDIRLAVMLGDGPVQIADGFGGWVEVPRHKNKSLTRWEGTPTIKLRLPLLFDRVHPAHRQFPIQQQMNQILQLGRSANGTEEPPIFRMVGNFSFSGRLFVMSETPEMGATIRGQNGNLLRQEMWITVMEYVRPDRLRTRRIPRRWQKKIRAKRGDTINKIARRVWKGRGRQRVVREAKRMARLNGIRDRNRRLKPGQVIKIPR